MSGPADPSRVVVVDDNPDWRLLVELALEDDDRFVVVGERGALSIEAAGQPADLALVDIGLCAAPAVLARVREASPGALVIVTSAHAPVAAAPAVQGGLGYLSKGTSALRLGDELAHLSALLGADDGEEAVAATVLPAERHSIREGRRFVTDALVNWGLANLVDIAVLLVSEVATNAVLHAGSSVDLVLRLYRDRLRIVVGDDSSTVLRRRNAAEGDSSGRGIELVESLSVAWGIDLVSGGKRVWFELARP